MRGFIHLIMPNLDNASVLSVNSLRSHSSLIVDMYL